MSICSQVQTRTASQNAKLKREEARVRTDTKSHSYSVNKKKRKLTLQITFLKAHISSRSRPISHCMHLPRPLLPWTRIRAGEGNVEDIHPVTPLFRRPRFPSSSKMLRSRFLCCLRMLSTFKCLLPVGNSSARTSTKSHGMGTLSGYKYDVFLSFRGADTRATFTDYLYTALTGAEIRVFKDDEDLCMGEEFAPELLQAIKQSKISIPIFSKNYASSVWCLKEIAQMVKCNNTGAHMILPIFYDVAPSEVRFQTGGYGDAFRSHESKKRHDEKTIPKWRDALKEVQSLNGGDLRSMRNRMLSKYKRMLQELKDRLRIFRAFKAHLTSCSSEPINESALRECYASSAWCLHELAHMMELKKSIGKLEILPIFYQVTPSNVKLRKELYVEDLEKHERRHGHKIRQWWEEALGKVGEMKGWEVQGKP